jgi:predicted amidohydrolase YtcJ
MNLILKVGLSLALASFCFSIGKAQTRAPDVILTNARILTVDEADNEFSAVAINGERISALGSTAEIQSFADADTEVIDVGGRTIVPGLIDSHIHAIRAGVDTARQVNWYDAASVEQGIQRLQEAADELSDDIWLYVVGAWNISQFDDPRLPTPEEIFQAAGEHPVYIQHMREIAFINEAAMFELGIATDADVPPSGRIERHADGTPTGRVFGDRATLEAISAQIPKRPLTVEEEAASIKTFLDVLARYGMTGVGDPMGGAFYPEDLRGLFHLWRRNELPIRVAYRMMSQNRGRELEDQQQHTALLPQSLGDNMLKFNGFGEVLLWDMYDGAMSVLEFEPKSGAIDRFAEMATWMAENEYAAEMHVASDVAAREVLDVLEDINSRHPITELRWSFVHLENGSPETLARMKELGMGYGIQDRLYFAGEQWVRNLGEERARRAPPIRTALDAGLVVAGGTDFPLSPYNPWVSIQWFIDGKTQSGVSIRGAEENPTRLEALRIYSLNSAWMSFDEDERGSLEVGKLADLAVLSADYLDVPTEEISDIESLLTMVGGRVVHSAGPFSRDAQ